MILKTEGYIADYVLIFKGPEIPKGVQANFEQIIQATLMPAGEHAPSLMWIEIAQKQELLWYSSEAAKREIMDKLDQW